MIFRINAKGIEFVPMNGEPEPLHHVKAVVVYEDVLGKQHRYEWEATGDRRDVSVGHFVKHTQQITLGGAIQESSVQVADSALFTFRVPEPVEVTEPNDDDDTSRDEDEIDG